VKSNESDLLKLAQFVYQDACARCTVNISDLRDLQTMKARVKYQGLSFLTITLPNFAKDFQRSLAIGWIDSTSFRSFRKNGAIPAFLQGMLSRIFDVESGGLYSEYPKPLYETAEIVAAVRQFCLTFNKILLPCTPAREYIAVEGFAQIERDLQSFEPGPSEAASFASVSRVLWTTVLSGFQPAMAVCSHGPGATVEGIEGNQKYRWQFWHERLEPYFPFLDNGYSVSAACEEEFESVAFVPSSQESPVKVTLVPKTLKSPRVIAIEPVCMQYVQQGIRSELYRLIGVSDIAGGHVNFTDQSTNQDLALTASRDGRLATIDLSEASDRVPHDLAMRMFDCNPLLAEAIEACRSTHAKLPDGRVLGPLRKFASMGSALCFPVEAMYFYTLCVLARLEIHNLPPSWANCKKLSRDVYVYGDDIVVPADETVSILDYLRKYNCKVNTHKTYWHGFFRESCGVDAYDGVEVTPTYIRRLRPKDRRQHAEIISWVETANSFYRKGCWRTAQYMFDMVERVTGPLPYVAVDSSAVGRFSYLGYVSVQRWNEKYQRFEVNALVPEPVHRTDVLDGYAALQKCLSVPKGRPSTVGVTWDPLHDPFGFEPKDEHHLERSARHGVVALKRRWVPAQSRI